MLRLDDAFAALMMLSTLLCTAGPAESLRCKIETESLERYRQFRTVQFIADSFTSAAKSGLQNRELWLQDVQGEYGLERLRVDTSETTAVLHWTVRGKAYRCTVPLNIPGGSQ